MRDLRFAIRDWRLRAGALRALPLPPIANRKLQIANPRAFTLVEAVFATLLVGMLLVAAMSTAGASARLQGHASDRGCGELLAQGLMNEILIQAYRDPGSSPIFGPEPGETTTPPSRTHFNDVDDYNAWSESPPQNKDGTTITVTNPDGTTSPAFPGWTRSVSVAWVNSSDLTTAASSETGIKRIIVTVTHNGALVATCVALKANNPAGN